MRFQLNREQEAFVQEIEGFLTREREKVKGLPREEFPYQFYADLGQTGWYGTAFPKEYGGHGRSWIDHALFLDVLVLGAPEPVWTAALLLGMYAPLIIQHGGEEVKKRFVPPMINGEIKICMGSTEPDCGSDTSGIKTRAIEDGDDYIINGTKIYNDAYLYENILTTTRTDPEAPKRDGITMFMVDLKSPGVTVSPIWTMWGFRRNEVNFEDVRVPKANMVGERGKGWYYLNSTGRTTEWALAGTPTLLRQNLNQLVSFVKQASHEGKPLGEIASIRHRLADLALEIELAELHYHHANWMISEGMDASEGAARTKLYSSELISRFYTTMIDITGQFGQLSRSGAAGKLAPLRGLPAVMYQYAPSQMIAGWSTEMQRNQIARSGLDLPNEW